MIDDAEADEGLAADGLTFSHEPLSEAGQDPLPEVFALTEAPAEPEPPAAEHEPEDMEPEDMETEILELEILAAPVAGDGDLRGEPPPSAETVEVFEDNLAGELAKLRQAITALDAAFKRQSPEPQAASEPSFADLLSDTVLRRAG